MKLPALHLLVPAFLAALLPGGALAATGPCTDGVDCLCDQLSGNASVIWCEDFDNLSWDDGTGNAFVSAGYGGAADGLCPTGPGSIDGDEGTEPDDCYNFVQNDSCDVAGETDCAFGNQSMGHKFDAGYTHGIMTEKHFGAATSFGITSLVKYSTNFVQNSNFKNTEFNSNTQSFHFGQDEYSFDGAKTPNGCADAGGSQLLENQRGDFNWATKWFYPPEASSCPDDIASSVSIRKGKVCCTTSQVVSWSPYGSDFEGGSFSWPLGQWGCLRTKITGVGTANTSVKQWWHGEGDTTDTLVVDFSGLDTRGLPGISSVRFNNYYNGANAVDSGYPNSSRAYRYEDNYVVTSGDPLSCAQVGFGASSPPDGGGGSGGGGTPPPPAAPTLLPD